MTRDITVDEPAEKELSTYKQQASRGVTDAGKTEIKTNEDYVKASDLLLRIKTTGKEVEDRKKRILDPINQAAKETRALFAPIEERIAEAESTLKGLMLEYRDTIAERSAEKEEELKAKIKAGEIEFAEAVGQLEALEELDKLVRSNRGATTIRTDREIVVVDEDKVADKYWKREIDKTAIKKAIDAGIKVRGVMVRPKEIVVCRPS